MAPAAAAAAQQSRCLTHLVRQLLPPDVCPDVVNVPVDGVDLLLRLMPRLLSCDLLAQHLHIKGASMSQGVFSSSMRRTKMLMTGKVGYM
jgi:hypothetical protein